MFESLKKSAIKNKVRNLIFSPVPLRFHFLRVMDRHFNLLKFARKLDYETIERPYYGHCLLHAAILARKLGHQRISAVEFGVAGGNGLVVLERHAEAVQRET